MLSHRVRLIAVIAKPRAHTVVYSERTEEMRREFQRHVQSLLGATSRARLKEAEAWFAAFRKMGRPAYELCIDIVSCVDAAVSMPDRLIAAQSIVWFCKRADFDVDFKAVATTIAAALATKDASLTPVLNQLSLAAAVYLCRQCLSSALAQQSRGDGTTGGFCAALGTFADAATVLRVLSSVPELALSREVKVVIPPGVDRSVLALCAWVAESRAVVAVLDGRLAYILSDGTHNSTGGQEAAVLELLQCAGQWVAILPEMAAVVCALRSKSTGAEDEAAAARHVGACMDSWLQSQLVSFVVGNMLAHGSWGGHGGMFPKACDFVVSLFNAMACTSREYVHSRCELTTTVLQLISARAEHDVAQFTAASEGCLSTLSTSTGTSLDHEGVIGSLEHAAETLCLRLESVMEILGACMPVCGTPSSSDGQTLPKTLVRSLEACVPPAMGALAEAFNRVVASDVRVPLNEISGGRTLPSLLCGVWAAAVSLKKWYMFAGERVLTLLHCMHDAAVDVSADGMRVVSGCLNALVLTSELMSEPYLVLSQQQQAGGGAVHQCVAIGLSDAVGPAVAALIELWSEDDNDNLKEFRTGFRNLLRAMASAYDVRHPPLYHSLLAWAFDGATVSLRSYADGQTPKLERSLEPDTAKLMFPRWVAPEAHLHLCSSVSPDLGSLCSGSEWRGRSISFLSAVCNLRQHKGMMRMGVVNLAELLPPFVCSSTLPEEEGLIRACLDTLLESVSCFPERIYCSGHPASVSINDSALPMDPSLMLQFEKNQQLATLSFRTKQDHIGVVSLLKVLQRAAAQYVAEGLNEGSLRQPRGLLAAVCASLNFSYGSDVQRGNADCSFAFRLHSTLVSLLVKSNWLSAPTTTLTWKSFLLYNEAVFAAAVPMRVCQRYLNWGCLHGLLSISDGRENLFSLEYSIGVAVAVGLCTVRYVSQRMNLATKHDSSTGAELSAVLDPMLLSRIRSLASEDSTSSAESILASAEMGVARSTFYSHILATGEAFVSQTMLAERSGDEAVQLMGQLVRAVEFISESARYFSAAAVSLSKLLNGRSDVIDRLAGCAAAGASAFVHVAQLLLPRIHDVVVSLSQGRGFDPNLPIRLYRTCVTIIDASCSALTPQTMGYCLPRQGAVGRSTLLCQCCTIVRSGQLPHSEVIEHVLSQAIAVLRAQCESLDSAAQTSSGGVALDALLYILQVLASGPLQMIKVFSQLVDVRAHFQMVFDLVLHLASRCEGIYSNLEHISLRTMDSLWAVVFRLQLCVLHIADYTTSNTDSCSRRRAIRDLQSKRGPVDSTTHRGSRADCSWGVVMVGAAEPPLPPLKSCLNASAVSYTHLVQIIRVTSHAIHSALSDQTGRAVVERESLVAGFNLLCAATGPVVVPTLCVSETGSRRNILVRAVDEDGFFVSSMDKSICNSWEYTGVLTDCFSTVTSTGEGGGSQRTKTGGNKPDNKDTLDIRPSSEPLGDPTLLGAFMDSEALENDFLRVVLFCIFCGKQRVDVLSAKEKESFSKFCLKVVIIFGLRSVLAARVTEARPDLVAAGSAWRAALAAGDARKLSNAIKKCFR